MLPWKRVYRAVTYHWPYLFVPLFRLSAVVSQYPGKVEIVASTVFTKSKVFQQLQGLRPMISDLLGYNAV
jgi:hypothetical protein